MSLHGGAQMRAVHRGEGGGRGGNHTGPAGEPAAVAILDLDTGERLLHNRVYLRELDEASDILNPDFIHEKVSNALRRSARIAAKTSV